MGITRWIDRVGFVSTSGGILASGFLQGLGVLSVRIELASIVLVVILFHAVLSSISITAFVGVSGLLFGVKLGLDGRSPTVQTEGGTVAAIVPVYQDVQALSRSIQGLLASTYDDLSVYIVCEPDDHASQRRAREFADHDRVHVLVNVTDPGSKASAINHAINQTASEYVAVFDADECIHPSFVGHAVSHLDRYDIVQGRTVPEPTGAVESVAYYESILLSYVGRRLLYLLTAFRIASSRAVVMRRSAFERVGGYDPEMLTEDFEFAYRCYQHRLSVRETLAYPSRIEAAHSLRDWWGQRKRWMTGYVQVFHRLVAEINPFDSRSVLSTAVCAGTIVGNVLMLSLLSKFLVLLVVEAEAWFLPPIGAVGAVALTVHLSDIRRVGLSRPGVYWLVIPALFPLYGLTMVKAVFEYLFTWDGSWYSVEKG